MQPRWKIFSRLAVMLILWMLAFCAVVAAFYFTAFKQNFAAGIFFLIVYRLALEEARALEGVTRL